MNTDLEEAIRFNDEHKATWPYDEKDEWAKTFACEICKQEMSVRFHRNGKPMHNTKLYVQRIHLGGIVHEHRHPLVCADVMKLEHTPPAPAVSEGQSLGSQEGHTSGVFTEGQA